MLELLFVSAPPFMVCSKPSPPASQCFEQGLILSTTSNSLRSISSPLATQCFGKCLSMISSPPLASMVKGI